MSTYFSAYATTTIDTLPLIPGKAREFPEISPTNEPAAPAVPASRWDYRQTGTLCGWLAALGAVVTAGLVVLAVVTVGLESWTATAILAGATLLALSCAEVLALIKVHAAMTSRAATESEQRTITEIEQQARTFYRAISRECREAVAAQGERHAAAVDQLRQTVQARAATVEQRVDELDDAFERGYVQGAVQIAESLAPHSTGPVRHIKAPRPRGSR